MVKRNYQCLICSMPILGIDCPGANLETAIFVYTLQLLQLRNDLIMMLVQVIVQRADS